MTRFLQVLAVHLVLTAILHVQSVSNLLAQAVPPKITFQGHITDSGGTPLNQVLPVHFKLYRDSLTSNHVWSESQVVSFQSGIFNVLLGSLTPLPDTVFSGQELYLGVAVDTDPEMTPRHVLVSTPYSFLSSQSMCVPAPWYTDDDEDGFGVAAVDTVFSCTMPVQYAPNVGDCDDTNDARYPGAEEVCDDVDNNCDFIVDSGFDTDGDNEDDLCDIDDDDDGVLDVDDDCPLVMGPEENNGCPL